MVSIRLFRNGLHRIVGFTVSGHAHSGPHGEDIVCAGVSALVQAAVIGLEEYLALEPVVEIDKGWLRCQLRQAEVENSEAQAILETMVLGLGAIGRQYPERVSIAEGR